MKKVNINKNNKKTNSKPTCWKCGKPGHKSFECRRDKHKKPEREKLEQESALKTNKDFILVTNEMRIKNDT